MYRFVEHTAELELELESGSAEGVLEEALRAFGELAGFGEGETLERPVDVRAPDLPTLLAAWLDELLFVAETERLLPDTARVSVGDVRVTGVIRGRHGDPRPLVKGVTLHRLRFRQENGVWRARVVLDV
ncbi:MAG: archease [Gaiellaceae bacterium]